jgi:hypothetical protein
MARINAAISASHLAFHALLYHSDKKLKEIHGERFLDDCSGSLLYQENLI